MHSHHDPKTGSFIIATQATLHCLLGCGIGEIVGLVVGTAFSLTQLTTIVLAIVLAFVFGYSLSLRSVVKNGVPLRKAIPIVFAADTLSITSMEITDNIVMAFIPGAMRAGLSNPLFWISLTMSLIAAFIVALPVNAYLIKRGKGHAVVHEHMQ